MSFNNVVPGSILNDYVERLMDSASYYVALSTTTNTKESNMHKTVELAHQTNDNRKAAADEAKRAAKSRKATAMVETHLYGGDPFASLTLSNDAGQTGDDNAWNPRHMTIRLNQDDLKLLQDAVFAARVELDKHTTKLTNPSLSTSAW